MSKPGVADISVSLSPSPSLSLSERKLYSFAMPNGGSGLFALSLPHTHVFEKDQAEEYIQTLAIQETRTDASLTPRLQTFAAGVQKRIQLELHADAFLPNESFPTQFDKPGLVPSWVI